jgi:prepilin-type N-terminal cleavage/methylation domain-containing protein/prepilin-type processing-associated H-X9-DG protein
MKNLLPYLSREPRQRAFTLIELLTVIAIIGILAAILIPVVGQVRDSARASKCVSNLRQIGAGLHLYASEHDGRAPGARWKPVSEAPSTNQSTWQWGIWTYVGYTVEEFHSTNFSYRHTSEHDTVFQCPTTIREVKRIPPLDPVRPGSLLNPYYSYSLNIDATHGQLGSGSDTDAQNLGVNLELLWNPTQTAAVVETPNWWINHRRFFNNDGIIPHGGGNNILFWDGSIRRLSYSEIPNNRLTVFWRGIEG